MTKPRSIAEFKSLDGRSLPKGIGGNRAAINRAIRRNNRKIVRDELQQIIIPSYFIRPTETDFLEGSGDD